MAEEDSSFDSSISSSSGITGALRLDFTDFVISGERWRFFVLEAASYEYIRMREDFNEQMNRVINACLSKRIDGPDTSLGNALHDMRRGYGHGNLIIAAHAAVWGRRRHRVRGLARRDQTGSLAHRNGRNSVAVLINVALAINVVVASTL